jgi:hypothetical protein
MTAPAINVQVLSDQPVDFHNYAERKIMWNAQRDIASRRGFPFL